MNLSGSETPLLILSLALVALSAGASDLCPDGLYRDAATSRCTPCTVCPVNTIVRAPCRATADTVCGPFFEFTFFNNDRVGYAKGTELMDAIRGQQTSNEVPERQLSPANGVTSFYRPDTNDMAGVNNKTQDAVQSSSDRWKELCFGLIGALAAVTSLALVFVVVTHLRHRSGSCKNSSLDDSEVPVVYYHTQITQHTPSPDRDVPLPHLSAQLRRSGEEGAPLNAGSHKGAPPAGGNEYVEAPCGSKTAASPFFLHSARKAEIPNTPLSRVHDSHRKHVERIRQQRARHLGGQTDPRQGAQLTEMLLTHHKCDAEFS